MTLVDVCERCGTIFEEGVDHCKRCGADREDNVVQREMRDLCYTYTGEAPEEDEVARVVKPIFEPRWGEAKWYEQTDEGKGKGKRRADR